jgi:ATP-dependent DNA helicase DinG
MQGEALSVIQWAIENDDFDNVVIQAPTGIGKSAIAMTVQGMHENAYLLTPSLGLTDQYKHDYSSRLVEVRGRSNFECWARSGTAEGAPCYKGKKRCKHTEEDDPCPYYAQKFKARNHRLTLSNPAYLFRVAQADDNFETRSLLMIDEAHKAEGFFMDLLEVTITMDDWILAYGGSLNMPHHYHPRDWVDEIKAMYQAVEKNMEAIDKSDPTQEQHLESLDKLKQRLSMLRKLLRQPDNVVIQVTADRVQFKPVRVGPYVPRYLNRLGRQKLFLSATILDIKSFLESLGLENERTLYVNITQSPFPKQNTKIHYAPCGPMSYGKRKNTIPKQIKAIARMMDHYSDERGVILPHSHAIRQEIVDGLIAAGYGDRILTHGSDRREREAVLNTFMTDWSKPYVLISTYVNEGFDFHGRLAEWLVLVKIPYGYTPDPQISTRMETDEHRWRAKHEGSPECPYEEPNQYSGGLCSSFTCSKPCQSWYNTQTALRMVQMAGRIVRTPEDVGAIYILDRGWDRFLRMNGHLLPGWFKGSLTGAPPWLKRHLP